MRSTDELDSLGLTYEVRRHGEASHSATEAAEALGLPVSAIIKTLVLVGRAVGPIVVLAPGDKQLNLAELRAELNDKTIHLASHEQTLELSGYPVGLVTPFGLANRLPVFSCQEVELLPQVAISSGEQGAELILLAADLLQATGATLLPESCSRG